MNKTATIILNRNLPKVADALVEHLIKNDKDYTDIFVLEAGSDNDKISKYCTWHLNTTDVKKYGLRYCRGMNFGLLQLWEKKLWDKYDSFFLLTNDTKFPSDQLTIKHLQNILKKFPRIGIVSPCSQRWSERKLIGKTNLKYFWFIHNNAYFFRKEMLEDVINTNNPTYMNFLFDGENFRGYLSEIEIISKAYANDWAAAITTEVMAEEEESYLLNQSDLIKTEPYDRNLKLYIDEGLLWVKKKYGFQSKWQMMQHSKLLYDKFFEYFPSESINKI